MASIPLAYQIEGEDWVIASHPAPFSFEVGDRLTVPWRGSSMSFYVQRKELRPNDSPQVWLTLLPMPVEDVMTATPPKEVLDLYAYGVGECEKRGLPLSRLFVVAKAADYCEGAIFQWEIEADEWRSAYSLTIKEMKQGAYLRFLDELEATGYGFRTLDVWLGAPPFMILPKNPRRAAVDIINTGKTPLWICQGNHPIAKIEPYMMWKCELYDVGLLQGNITGQRNDDSRGGFLATEYLFPEEEKEEGPLTIDKVIGRKVEQKTVVG